MLGTPTGRKSALLGYEQQPEDPNLSVAVRALPRLGLPGLVGRAHFREVVLPLPRESPAR